MILTRRSFLSALGLGTAAAGIAIAVPEPVRRFWQVGRNAPVGGGWKELPNDLAYWSQQYELHVKMHQELLGQLKRTPHPYVKSGTAYAVPEHGAVYMSPRDYTSAIEAEVDRMAEQAGLYTEARYLGHSHADADYLARGTVPQTLAGRLDTLNELHRAGALSDADVDDAWGSPGLSERIRATTVNMRWHMVPGASWEWWDPDAPKADPDADLVVAGIDHERNRITLSKA